MELNKLWRCKLNFKRFPRKSEHLWNEGFYTGFSGSILLPGRDRWIQFCCDVICHITNTGHLQPEKGISLLLENEVSTKNIRCIICRQRPTAWGIRLILEDYTVMRQCTNEVVRWLSNSLLPLQLGWFDVVGRRKTFQLHNRYRKNFQRRGRTCSCYQASRNMAQ